MPWSSTGRRRVTGQERPGSLDDGKHRGPRELLIVDNGSKDGSYEEITGQLQECPGDSARGEHRLCAPADVGARAR